MKSPRPAAKRGDPDSIWTNSIVSSRTKQGVVVVEWGNQVAQFNPEEVRKFAHTLMREADNAETDAFVYAEFANLMNENQLAGLLMGLRKARALRELAAGLRTVNDEIPEEETR